MVYQGFMEYDIRGYRHSIFDFFKDILPLRSNPMPLKKFENLQIKNYIKHWENEYRTSSFSFFLDQSQHTTQQAVIKSNKANTSRVRMFQILQNSCSL